MRAAEESSDTTAMRALGLDVGTKKIGVALTDALGIAAHPLSVLERSGTKADVAAIASLIAEYEVTDLVVGLPLEMSGKVGLRASRVRRLISALEAGLGDSVRLHEWDERFSTVAVERVLIAADVSRNRRKKVIDKQAAAFILQGWLDSQVNEQTRANTQATSEDE